MDQTLSKPTAPAEKTRANERLLTPPVDIYETADGFSIVADLPGVAPEGVSVEYNPPELYVRGRVANGGGAVAYERRFEIGSGVDPTSIEAELKLGVLQIRVKKAEARKPRRIDVRGS